MGIRSRAVPEQEEGAPPCPPGATGRCVTKGRPASSFEMRLAKGCSRINRAASAGSVDWKWGGWYMAGLCPARLALAVVSRKPR